MTDRSTAWCPITDMNSVGRPSRAFVSMPRRGRLHLVQRPGRADLGPSTSTPERWKSRCCSSPISTSAATPRFQLGYPGRCHGASLGPARRDLGGLDERMIKEARFLLWKGHCSVHQRFRPEHVADFRKRYPDGRVIVHPECSHEVVDGLADEVAGSTDYIIGAVDRAPRGHGARYRHRDPPGAAVFGAEHPHLRHRVSWTR